MWRYNRPQVSNSVMFLLDHMFDDRAQQCGRAALLLCEHVRGHHKIPLMTEVIIERDLLALDMRIGNRDPAIIIQDYDRKCFPAWGQ